MKPEKKERKKEKRAASNGADILKYIQNWVHNKSPARTVTLTSTEEVMKVKGPAG